MYLHSFSFQLKSTRRREGISRDNMDALDGALDGIPLYVEFAEEVSIHNENCNYRTAFHFGSFVLIIKHSYPKSKFSNTRKTLQQFS